MLALRVSIFVTRFDPFGGIGNGFFLPGARQTGHFLVILEDERGAYEPRVAANASTAFQPDRRLADRVSGGCPTGRQDVEQTRLLRELLAAQDRQNELLEEMISQFSAAQKQRANELGQWKQANPHLARSCRMAAEALGKVQTEFLESLTAEVSANYENLLDGEFMLNEFVDRFGPRMAHLNGLLQVLSQLSATPNPTGAPNAP